MAFAIHHETGRKNIVASANVSAGGGVHELGGLIVDVRVVNFEQGDARGGARINRGGVAAGREGSDDSGISATGSQGKGADGGEGDGISVVPLGVGRDFGGVADGRNLRIGEDAADTELGQAGVDRADDGGFIAGAGDDEAGDGSARDATGASTPGDVDEVDVTGARKIGAHPGEFAIERCGERGSEIGLGGGEFVGFTKVGCEIEDVVGTVAIEHDFGETVVVAGGVLGGDEERPGLVDGGILEGGELVDTVEHDFGVGRGFGDTSERREPIDVGDHLVALGAGGNLAGPAGETRQADAAFEGRTLAPTEAPAVAVAVIDDGAVVGNEDDEGIVGHALGGELGGDTTDGEIHTLNHGVVSLGVVAEAGVVGFEFSGGFEGRVGRIEADGEKKGFSGVTVTDDGFGLGGEEVGGLADVGDGAFVAEPAAPDPVVEGAVVVGAGGEKTEKVVEAAVGGVVVRSGFANVPFTDEVSGVTGVAEDLGEKALGEGEAGLVSADGTAEAEAVGVATGVERHAGGSARGWP